MKKILVFQAPVFTASGYGSHARDIAKVLFELDEYDVKIAPTRWGMTPQNQVDPKTEFGKRMIDSVVTGLDKRPEVYIQMSVPNEFRKMGHLNIGITAGTETDKAPKEFIQGINNMDLVIVPSEFTKDTFITTYYEEKDPNTGRVVGQQVVRTPIITLFEGIDVETYGNTHPSDADPLEGVTEDFNFLICGHWLPGSIGQDRKDIGMTIKTIATVFRQMPKDKRPGIILKTSAGGYSVKDRELIRKRIDAVLEPLGDDVPSVYLLHGDLTDKEMSNLYHHPKVKAMVSFTKGEGYGRPLAEFAMTGKPILVSKWSGHTDFLPEGNVIYLEGGLTEVDKSAANKFILQESKWFTVNYTDAANKLYDVYKSYDKALKKSAKLPDHMKKNFSMEKMKNELKRILKEKDDAPVLAPIKLPELPSK